GGQEVRQVLVDVAQDHTHQDGADSSHKGHEGDIGQAADAHSDHGQHGAVVDGQQRHGRLVHGVTVGVHQGQIDGAVGVRDGGDDGQRAQAQHTSGAEHLAHHNADGGADDELGDQQHTAPLDNAAHVPDPQRGAQAEQLDTDGGVGAGTGEDGGGEGADVGDLRKEGIDNRAEQHRDDHHTCGDLFQESHDHGLSSSSICLLGGQRASPLAICEHSPHERPIMRAVTPKGFILKKPRCQGLWPRILSQPPDGSGTAHRSPCKGDTKTDSCQRGALFCSLCRTQFLFWNFRSHYIMPFPVCQFSDKPKFRVSASFSISAWAVRRLRRTSSIFSSRQRNSGTEMLRAANTVPFRRSGAAQQASWSVDSSRSIAS
ncbi:Tyrosine recombinase XerD, partial [Dysosmobacter welbionis]